MNSIELDDMKSLTLNEYQQAARSTAVYPNQEKLEGLLYTILGLAGEAGETADQTKKILRDDAGLLTAERMDKITKEIGDTLWYIANATHELNALALANGLPSITLEDIAKHNLNKLLNRKVRGVLCGDGGMR